MTGLMAPLDPEPTMEPDPPKRKTALAVMSVFTVLAAGVSFFGGGVLNPQASTSDGDYAGETVQMMIPLAEGGGTDTWARFVGQELTRTVPGEPGLAPVNDDGGEGITGTNKFATSARNDGTQLMVSTASTVVPWLLGRAEVAYDFDNLTPILANGTGGVIYARTGAGVSGVENLVDRDKPLKFGGISATSLDLTTLLAFKLLDMDVEPIFGFEGRGPVNLALQRGEIDLDYQTTSAYGRAVEPMVKDGAAVPLMSFGQVDENGDLVRDPNFPDIPTVAEVYETLHGKEPTGEAFEAYRTVLGITYTYQKALWVPGGTPQAAVTTLRQSADKLSKDPAFNKRAEEVLGGYPIEADAQLSQRIKSAYQVDDSVREYVVELLHTDYQIELG